MRQARSLTETEARYAHLTALAPVLNDPFLDGCDVTGINEDWLVALREKARQEVAEAWFLLAETAVQIGEVRNAHEAAHQVERLLRGQPATDGAKSGSVRDKQRVTVAYPDVVALLLRLPPEPLPPVPLSDGPMLLQRLFALDTQSLKPTVREQKDMVRLVADTLQHLPRTEAEQCLALAVFPDSFTARQAERIAGVPDRFLSRLMKMGFLQETPVSPEAAAVTRYHFSSVMREHLRTQLPAVRKRQLRIAHYDYFSIFEGDGWPELPYTDTVYTRWIAEERANLNLALETCLQKPLDTKGNSFITLLFTLNYQSEAGLQWEVLRRSRSRLEEFAQSTERDTVSIAHAWKSLAELALHESDFARAVRLSHNCLRAMQGKLLSMCFYELLLNCTHYAGDDAAFDEAVALAFAVVPHVEKIYPLPLHKELFERHIWWMLAENQYARGQLESALAANLRAEEFNQLVQVLPHYRFRYRDNLYQRGCILRAMGRYDEALPLFDIALQSFTEDNVRLRIADCLQSIGAIWGEKGILSMARRSIEQAIALYTETGVLSSRAAALGTLGDQLVRSGNIAEARQLYEEGLIFWRSNGHHRWIRIFEERLAKIQEPSLTVEAKGEK